MENSDLANNQYHHQAVYCYLNYFYDCLLEDKKTLVPLKKFQNMLSLPMCFAKNFYDFIQNEKNILKQKKLFMEFCFVFFNSYSITDKKTMIEYIFKAFKKSEENFITSENLILTINYLILEILIKLKKKNFEEIL